MSERRRLLRGGAYLLPSFFTIGNVVLGFTAIVLGLDGRFRLAALLVIAAGFLDSIDGRIARLTGTESAFGKEFDSLADVLTFGSTPALLAYLWGLGEQFGRLGWLVPLFYLVSTATRLARFNVQTKILDSRFFVGLPAPAAAGAFCCFLLVAPGPDWRPWMAAFLLVLLVTLGVLMVSTFRYPSFKDVHLRRRWSYRVALPLAAVLLLAIYHPEIFLVSLSAIYLVSGPAIWLRGHRGSRAHSEEGTTS